MIFCLVHPEDDTVKAVSSLVYTYSLHLFDQVGLLLSGGGQMHIQETVGLKARGQDGEGYIIKMKWKKFIEIHGISWANN